METSVDSTMRERSGTRRKRRWIFGWIGLASVIGAIWLFAVGGTKVPVHNGVPVDVYLGDLGNWRTQQNYEASLQAIRSLGTNALPYYATVGFGPRPWYAVRVEGLHLRYPNSVTAWLDKRVNSAAAFNRRKGARRALDYFKYDNNPHSVTNDLTKMLMTAPPRDVQTIASLINAFGGDSALAVVPWLADPDPVGYRLACRVISDCGPAGSNAIPALVELYQRDPACAEDAFSALKRMGAVSRPIFADALRSNDPQVLKVALRFVRTDPAMLEQTIPMLTDTDLKLRSAAAMTIVGWRLSAENRTIMSVRKDGLDESFSAVVGLTRGKPELLEVIDEVFPSLPEFEQVRAATAYCLYAGTENSFVEFLENRAENDVRSKRIEAERALASIYNSQSIK